MKKVRLIAIALISLSTACVSTKVAVPHDHPANPDAPVSQVALTPALAGGPASVEASAPAGHQHGGHDHHGPGSAPTEGAPAAAAVPGMGETKQADKPAAEVWTCPMHPEVVKSGPGQCPICGMNLVKRAPAKAK